MNECDLGENVEVDIIDRLQHYDSVTYVNLEVQEIGEAQSNSLIRHLAPRLRGKSTTLALTHRHPTHSQDFAIRNIVKGNQNLLIS